MPINVGFVSNVQSVQTQCNGVRKTKNNPENFFSGLPQQKQGFWGAATLKGWMHLSTIPVDNLVH